MNPEIADVLQAQVGGKIAALNIMDIDVDTFVINIKDMLTKTAEYVERSEKGSNHGWQMRS